MKIRIGFSPCPNDTFIFDALVNGKIDTAGYQFELVLADVEELNRMAKQGELDITKISVGAFPFVVNNYVMLDSGAALGNGVGPLLVTATGNLDLNKTETRVAIPGDSTTANLLLRLFMPHLKNKQPMLFSDIETAVLDGVCDAGVLIHEGRFTYQQKGLQLAFDLGQAWEDKFHMPLPLGCICASRKLETTHILRIDSLISSSVRFAFQHPESSQEYVSLHAQEMDPTVVKQHIDLYVNDYSVALGTRGRAAISTMIETCLHHNGQSKIELPIFSTDLK
ncbi:MAG: 1,4-dihydroxy-6-naphthoate synthase [Bacteroidota bacterium]